MYPSCVESHFKTRLKRIIIIIIIIIIISKDTPNLGVQEVEVMV